MPEGLLAVDEDVVPEPGLGVALELRQVEVRPASPTQRLRAVVEQVEPEVEQAGRHRDVVDEHARLDEVPAARPDQQRRDLVVEPVGLAFRRLEGQLAADRVDQGRLAADDVRPGRRQRILEVGHEDARAGVEGVDHHLGLGRSGDLDPPIVEIGRGRRDGPIGLADLAGRPQERRAHARVQLDLALLALAQQLDPKRTEPSLEVGDERERVVGQDALRARDRRASELDAGRHQAVSLRRTVASISPCGSVVGDVDLAVVGQPERLEVGQPVMEVGQDHPDLLDRLVPLEDRPGHDPDRRLDGRAVVVGKDLEQGGADRGERRIEVEIGRPVAPDRRDLRGHQPVVGLLQRRVPIAREAA